MSSFLDHAYNCELLILMHRHPWIMYLCKHFILYIYSAIVYSHQILVEFVINEKLIHS